MTHIHTQDLGLAAGEPAARARWGPLIRWLAVITAAIGGTALVGYTFDIALLRRVLPIWLINRPAARIRAGAAFTGDGKLVN